MYRLEKLKEKARTDTLLAGANVLFGDADISELFGFAGCDFVWIDMEHSPLSYKDAEQHIMGAHAGGAAAFVRLPWNDMVMVKRVLDMGPDGVIFPLIRTVQDVENAVSYCTYPPKGVRGWNPIRAVQYGCADTSWYIENAESLVWKILMIEHVDAVTCLEKILEVPGIDAVMIGPSDLSGSMNQMLKTDTEEFWKLIERITDIAGRKGKVIGVAVPADCTKERLEKWMDYGVTMFSLGQDANMLSAAAKLNIEKAKEVFAGRKR